MISGLSPRGPPRRDAGFMTSTSDTSQRPVTAAGRGRDRWVMLAVLLAGQFMALLDGTGTVR